MLQAGVLRRLLTGGPGSRAVRAQQRTGAALQRPVLASTRGAGSSRAGSSSSSITRSGNGSSSGGSGSSNKTTAPASGVAPSTAATSPAAQHPSDPQQQQHQQQQHQQPGHGIRLPSPRMPLQQFEVSLEEVLHNRYLTLYNRRVRFSAPPAAADGTGHAHQESDRVLDFDIIGHPQSDFRFAVTFPFHPYKDGRKGGEVTVIREYAQGPNQLMYCLPTGGLDRRKHSDLEACAKAELSEEALLAGGRWVPLLPPEHPGLTEVKWCMNRFRPYLCIDPTTDAAPGSRDAEEVSIEVLRVPLDEFRRLMVGGDMLLPSIATGYLALDRLRDDGLL